MARLERVREVVQELPTAEELQRRADQGWKLAAVEWQRDAEAEDAEASRGTRATSPSQWREAPYGLEIPDAGGYELVQQAHEEAALRLMLRMVIDDRFTLAEVAGELNSRGFRTRGGKDWSQGAVFDMLPRLVDVAPKLYASPDWATERGAARHPA